MRRLKDACFFTSSFTFCEFLFIKAECSLLKKVLTDHCIEWENRLTGLLNDIAREELESLMNMFQEKKRWNAKCRKINAIMAPNERAMFARACVSSEAVRAFVCRVRTSLVKKRRVPTRSELPRAPGHLPKTASIRSNPVRV